MSVIGEVASITGIISLAGQTLQAASSVYNLLKAYKRVQPRVLDIQAEVARLIETLQSVTPLGVRSSNPASDQLTNLQTSVLRCESILENLRKQLKPLEATSTGFFKKFLKKTKIAADVEYFSIISQQIHQCRADVSLHLEVLHGATGLVICGQMNKVTVGLDKIRESQAATSDILLISRSDIRADTVDARSEQRLAFSSLSSKVDQIIAVRPTATAIAPGNLALMDARLRLLESRLAESMQSSKMKSDPPLAPASGEEVKVECFPMRLIKPGILKYEENGTIISELIPIDDRKAMKLDFEARLNLIRHVQGLRVLIWLMREDNYRSSVQSQFGVIPQSSLTWQAKVTSFWEFCNSCTEYGHVLEKWNADMASTTTWETCYRWLLYLIDRVYDREQDGENITILNKQNLGCALVVTSKGFLIYTKA